MTRLLSFWWGKLVLVFLMVHFYCQYRRLMNYYEQDGKEVCLPL